MPPCSSSSARLVKVIICGSFVGNPGINAPIIGFRSIEALLLIQYNYTHGIGHIGVDSSLFKVTVPPKLQRWCEVTSSIESLRLLPCKTNWSGILLIAWLVVLVSLTPSTWVNVIVCCGKSSSTSCTAYGPSLVLLVLLKERVQDCTEKHWFSQRTNLRRGGRFYCLTLTDDRFSIDGGAQGAHSYNESDPNLHSTLSPSGSNAIKLKSLWQFEGTLKDKSYWLSSSLNVSFSSQLLSVSVDLEHKRLYVSLDLSSFWFPQSFCLSHAQFMLPLFLTFWLFYFI